MTRLAMEEASRPIHSGGYAPIRDYAAIGDGRTVALVARDGSVDWLPLPNLDSPSVFAAVVDADRGGRFWLAPEVPFQTTRRYVPGTNVVETTFATERGAVRVTDALTLPTRPLGPFRELVRRIEGIAGRVPMGWRVEPRFGYASRPTRIDCRGGVPRAVMGRDALAVMSFGAGDPELRHEAIAGRFDADETTRALISMVVAHQEPLVLPTRKEVEARLEETVQTWKRWADDRRYDGPWREAVIRSALTLKLLVFAPTGAVAAAATTSLPEEIGGERNWDYRFSWIRDSAVTLDAFLRLGCSQEAHAYFWWLMHASQLTHPRLQVLYRLDGGATAPEEELDLAGHRGSKPVRIGNAAVDQLQLDTYGELLQAAWLYACSGARIDRDIAKRLAGMADLVCRLWQHRDAGIWEVRDEARHFTQSKMMCWIALDRASALADRGVLPRGHADRWRRQREEIRAFVESSCWSPRKRAYTRSNESEDLDAGVLLGLLLGYADPGNERLATTVDAVRRELAQGPYVRRYSGDDGLSGTEGAFVTCSFWLAESLARAGRTDEAVELMEQLVGLANDVGLYAEEIDAHTGEFLGNIPQGLSHLALISAAVTISEAAGR
jgi:GH15 family glucan-1,4-alpha-glucosidase